MQQRAARIGTVGSMATFLCSWDNPSEMGRAWCLMEAFAAHCSGAHPTILLSSQQKLRLHQALETDCSKVQDTLLRVLGSINISDAQTSEPADKQCIDAWVNSSYTYVELNEAVANQLVACLMEQNLVPAVVALQLVAARGMSQAEEAVQEDTPGARGTDWRDRFRVQSQEAAAEVAVGGKAQSIEQVRDRAAESRPQSPKSTPQSPKSTPQSPPEDTKAPESRPSSPLLARAREAATQQETDRSVEEAFRLAGDSPSRRDSRVAELEAELGILKVETDKKQSRKRNLSPVRCLLRVT